MERWGFRDYALRNYASKWMATAAVGIDRISLKPDSPGGEGGMNHWL
jgi:hypothetical protein